MVLLYPALRAHTKGATRNFDLPQADRMLRPGIRRAIEQRSRGCLSSMKISRTYVLTEKMPID